jgi:predicted DNA-binding protein (MmcQ/YjbR family)
VREKIFAYVKQKYGVAPDYPFPTAPTFPVLRHQDNRKWFALIMDVPRDKLGLEGAERVDVINVKLGDPMLADWLAQQDGFFRGYHIKGGSWVSVLLDNTVPLEEIAHWIDESYAMTASRQTKQRLRQPQ